MEIIIFSIITGYMGIWIPGLLGFEMGEGTAIFALMGFLVPAIYRLEKIYQELIKLNKKE